MSHPPESRTMDNPVQAEQRVNIKTAAMLTGKCAHTLRKWAARGLVESVMASNGRPGNFNSRQLFDLASLAPHTPARLTKKFIQTLLKAEKGDVESIMAVAEHLLSCGPSSLVIPWYEEAATKGDPTAMNTLSECYFRGFGVKRNDALGLKWLSEAAIHGNVSAQSKVDTLALLLSDNGFIL